MKNGERLEARIQGAFLDMERAVVRAELLAKRPKQQEMMGIGLAWL